MRTFAQRPSQPSKSDLSNEVRPREGSIGTRGRTVAAPSIVSEVISSPGTPLAPETRAFMEPRFGHDFGKVRVHAGGRASDSAGILNASAYTIGSHVVFRGEVPSISTIAGRHLLSHELTHVVQQSRGGEAPPLSPHAAYEHEAAEAASAVAAGHSRVNVSVGTGIGIARSEPDLVPDLEVGLETQKARALDILQREGIPAPAGKQSVGKPKRIPSPRINDVVRALERVAGDPGSPRAGEARRLLDDIGRVRRELRDGNRARDDGRALGEHPPPDSNRQTRRQAASSQKHRGKQEPRTRRGGAPDPNRVKTPAVPNTNFKATDLDKKGGAPPAPPKANGGGGLGMPKVAATSTNGKLRSAIAKIVEAGKLNAIPLGKQLVDRLPVIQQGIETVTTLLDVMEMIETSASLLANGTALPKEQAAADAVLQQATQAEKESEWATQDLSPMAWYMTITEADRLEDDGGLYEIDAALGQIQTAFAASVDSLQGAAHELEQQAIPIDRASTQQLISSYLPKLTTAANATALGMHLSLSKLNNTLRAAAMSYRQAAATLDYWAEQAGSLSKQANEAAWLIRRDRRAKALQAGR